MNKCKDNSNRYLTQDEVNRAYLEYFKILKERIKKLEKEIAIMKSKKL